MNGLRPRRPDRQAPTLTANTPSCYKNARFRGDPPRALIDPHTRPEEGKRMDRYVDADVGTAAGTLT